MRDYVSELVAHLRLSFSQRRDIHFQLEVGPVFLDVAQAVPIGLLLNEAITNAMKYAFPSEVVEHPEICISLQELPPENSIPDGHAQGRLELTITDNGVGLNQAFDPKANRSLGMELIHTMAQQLEGTLTMKNVHGLAISVRFQRKETVLDEGAAA
jgi:two-component sensor histidine kinase